jgi:hypothetical protein
MVVWWPCAAVVQAEAANHPELVRFKSRWW